MSSAAYTLHVAPFARRGDPAALDRADLVRDAFSWGAFLVPMLWFFSHRHLWLGLGALLVVVGFGLVLWFAGVGGFAVFWAEVFLHLLFGFEAPSLRRWAYARRGRPAVDVVCASDMADAEAKTFRRWLEPDEAAGGPNRGEAVRAARSPARPAPDRSEPVIGLFPEPERGR